MKNIISIILTLFIVLSIASCSSSSPKTTESSSANSSSGSSSSETSSNSNTSASSTVTPITNGKTVGYQLDSPADGEEIAIIHTSMGDIYLRLFPDDAPKTVENFVTHAKEGYYNNLIFHRVIDDFMIQGGDPKGNGTGGESIWKNSFEDEFSPSLINIRGSVAMANSGKNTNGSQFFINQANNASDINWDTIQESYNSFESQLNALSESYTQSQIDSIVNSYYTSFCNPSLMSDEVKKLYKEKGGNYFLDGSFNSQGRGHTVFAQVFDGMDVVDKIAKVKVDSSNKPEEDVKIKSIEITKYNKNS